MIKYMKYIPFFKLKLSTEDVSKGHPKFCNRSYLLSQSIYRNEGEKKNE